MTNSCAIHEGAKGNSAVKLGAPDRKSQKEKSELESSIDVYRTKQDRVRFLEIGIGIATGLLKGLPPVILTNTAVVFVLSIGTYDLSVDEQYIRDVGITSLVGLLEVFTLMAWLDRMLVPRLTKDTHHSDDELALVNALRKITAAGFKSYLVHLPRIRPEKLHWSNLDESGSFDRVKHDLEWRKVHEIPRSIQLDMEHMSGPLTKQMDELSKECIAFAESFDHYASAFKAAGTRFDKKKVGEVAATTQYMKSAIIGSYLYFAGFVPDERAFQRIRSDWSLNSETETFLREFLKGDTTNPNEVSFLRGTKNLEDAAKLACERETSAIRQLELVEPAVRDFYRKWELRLQ